MPEVAADEMAAILFTSGSTGPPKGAVYTHGMFAAQVRLLKETFGLEPGEIDLCTFPLFALFAPALGWSAILPEMDFTRPGSVEPAKIFGPIKRWGVTNLFGSPALLERVALAGEGKTLPTLRRVITAGAPVRPNILEAFSRMLAGGAPIHTPYGATEALPVSSIASQEILSETRNSTAEGKGNCVGKPVASMKVRIIKISDEPITKWGDELMAPPGEVGEIVVQGPVVSREYWERPEQTALAKIADGERFWHRMGDVGYFDPQGRLWMCGRKSHRVILKDRTLFTIPCEGVFNVHPKVRRTALVGVSRRCGVEPVLCVEPRPKVPASEHKRIAADLLELGAKHEHTRLIQTILFHPSFPVDIRHNAKIFREQLAEWAARRVK
jgi:acyl-CoA synthetase (AMP-forming)/AMP-acid ligase II